MRGDPMLKRQNIAKSNQVKVTFVVPVDKPNTAVVGTFNNWDPTAHPLKKRANGTRSAALVLDRGKRHLFRYYSEDGVWFNDEAADAYEQGEFGCENCVLLT